MDATIPDDVLGLLEQIQQKFKDGVYGGFVAYSDYEGGNPELATTDVVAKFQLSGGKATIENVQTAIQYGIATGVLRLSSRQRLNDVTAGNKGEANPARYLNVIRLKV